MTTKLRVRLTQIDGKLPNLALMKLARFHRDQGDEIVFSRRVVRDLWEGEYDRIYGSAIFDYSAPQVAEFQRQFPGAIVGGTWDTDNPITVEDVTGRPESEAVDYGIYPRFDASIGFTQRGCRLRCGFCVVPRKEGKPRTVNNVAGIWRGEPYPRHLHLLDNDFFGQPEAAWQGHLDAIRDGGFKVCLNQGINIRLVDEVSASRLARLPYYDDAFKRRRLYTAWDNIGDERRFTAGVDLLERHGVPPTHLMAYMLIGYDRRETWERVFYRFERMVARGIRPYPMIYGDRHRGLPLGGHNARIGHRTLGEFQRWACGGYHRFIPFAAYDAGARGPTPERPADLFGDAA